MHDVWDEIVKKLRKFVHEAGFKKVVVGASGGIDSSVVACLAAIALGTENVLLVLMPSKYSSGGSIDDTKELASNWELQTALLPIPFLVTEFNNVLSPSADDIRTFSGALKSADTFTEENLQARIRSVLLMALSNEHQCLVLNTCNKSEDYTGYCTLYGDSCGAIAPIGDLYKTEVYELAHWINDDPNLPNIPEVILTKEPSAELTDGQLDTDTLPPYDVLDFILKWYLDDGTPFKVMQEAGHDPALVERVLNLIHSSAYKRAQSAPVLKLARRSR